MNVDLTKINQQSKYWIYTWNNPNVTDEDYLKYNEELLDNGLIEWAAWQKEQGGQEHTPHYQGVVCFASKKRRKEASKMFPKANLKPSTNPRAAIQYCTKEDGTKDGSIRLAGPWTVGEPHAPRKNNADGAWAEIRELCSKGVDDKELCEKFPYQFANNYNAIQKIRSMYYKEQPVALRPINVELIVGCSGVGKSTRVFSENKYAFRKKTGTKWWDGYSYQDAVIFEDYNGYFAIEEFFTLLDPFPVYAEVKGSTIEARWTKVYITSNNLPHIWYRDDLNDKPPFIKALFRRMHTVHVVNKNNVTYTYKGEDAIQFLNWARLANPNIEEYGIIGDVWKPDQQIQEENQLLQDAMIDTSLY